MNGKSSYNNNWGYLHVDAEKGKFALEPAFGYGGLDGSINGKPMNIQNNIQQAAQMDDFADCVKLNRHSRVPGEEGLKDMRIIDAIYRSLNSNKWEQIV